MIGLGTRDTTTGFALTNGMHLHLRRELRRLIAACGGGGLVVILSLLTLFAPVRPQLFILAWCGIIMAALSLSQTAPDLYWALRDLRSGSYVRRSGAVRVDLTATQGKNGGTIRYWLQMMGQRSAIPRDTYHMLRGSAYAVLEELPSGTLLRVRDFDGQLLYQRWAGCDFPPQEGENASARSAQQTRTRDG